MWSLVILTKVRSLRKKYYSQPFGVLPHLLGVIMGKQSIIGFFHVYLTTFYSPIIKSNLKENPETFSKITGIWNRIRMLGIGILKSKKNIHQSFGEIFGCLGYYWLKKTNTRLCLRKFLGVQGWTQIGKICSLATDLWPTDMTIVRSCACLRGRRDADDGFSSTNCV